MTEDVGIRLSLQGRREAALALAGTEQDLKDVGDAAARAGDQAEQSGRKWERTRGVLGAVGRGAVIGVKLLGGLAVAGAAVGIKTAAAMETAKIGFTTMLGSAKRARSFLGDLEKFASRTPFEFPELQTAASSLVSAGIESKKVIPIMTTLGDVTAGMGTGSEGIKRATNALQQMNAAQRISAEDLNQLRDAGIPVYDLLASALGKSKEEVVALKDEGKLGKDALDAMMGALQSGKGLERFNGLMEAQSRSLTGRWSTFTDTVTMGLAKAVKPALPLVKDLLVLATDLAERAMPKIETGLRTGVKAVRRFVDGFKGGGGVEGALATLSAPGIPTSAGAIGDAITGIGDSIRDVDWGSVKEGLGEGFADTISVAGFAIGVIADHLPEVAKYLPLIVAGFAAWKVAQAAGNLAAVAAVPLTIAQTVSNFALAGAMRAQTAATVGATTAQKRLNLAFLASPLGIVIGALILVGGALYLAYQKSETFRGIVDTLFNGVLKPFGEFLGGVLLDGIRLVAQTLLGMARYGFMAFRLLLTGAIKTFDGILWAAEKGLGWIPGIGDKIKGARAAFNEFGDSTIAKLKRVEDRLQATSAKLDDVGRDRTATITVNTVYTGLTAPGGSGPMRGRDDELAPGRARGGSVLAGRPYVVGERRAELFVPRVHGKIVPRVPDSPAELMDLDPGAFDGTTMGRYRDLPPIHVHLELDGRELTTAVVGGISDEAARQ
jgi:tape measure domain-containing protein